MARPSHQPSDKSRQEVESLSAVGLPHPEIASIIGVSHNTLTKHYRRELALGHSKANAQVAKTLFKQAVGGNTVACIFWLKARAGWRDRVDVSNEDGSFMRPLADAVRRAHGTR